MAQPPKLAPSEAVAFFRALMWRAPDDRERSQIEAAANSLSILSTIWELDEYRRDVAPLLGERVLDTFAKFIPELNDEYLRLCGDLRAARLPAPESERPTDIVFLAYVLCLHRAPDPVGFLQYCDNLIEKRISVRVLFHSLLAAGEAQATLEPRTGKEPETAHEFVASLKHKSKSVDIVL